MFDSGTVVAAYLANALGSDYTYGSNVFNGPVRPMSEFVPAEAIFCLETLGHFMFPNRESEPDVNDGSPTQLLGPTVQIRVRSDVDNYGAGKALAGAVRTALHMQLPSGFLESRVREAIPYYLGQDTAGCHEWSMNLDMLIDDQR